MKRIAQSDLLKLLQCHLLYVGDHPEVLNEPADFLTAAGLDVVVEYRYGDVAENIYYNFTYTVHTVIHNICG